MRAPRVFLEGAKPGSAAAIRGPMFHHLVRVLRRKEGDPLVVLDGKGGAFQASIAGLDRELSTLRVEVGEPLPEPAFQGKALTIALGIPRADGFEIALRWASEMGVRRLIPLLTERGTVRVPAGEKGRAQGKLGRWRRIALESAEQCRRPVPLEVGEPVALDDLFEGAHTGSCWIALPGGGDLASSAFLESLRGSRESEVLVLVGPEGGFSPGEVSRALEAGFEPVGFPTFILRTPTAVAYLGALASTAKFLGTY